MPEISLFYGIRVTMYYDEHGMMICGLSSPES